MDRIAITTLITVLLLTLVGCTSNVREDEYVNGKLKLIFWHAMGGPLGDVLNEMVKRYNKESNKYHVHTEFMGNYGILEQKIIASVMAGKTPDVAQMYEGVTMLLTRDEGEESLQKLNRFTDKWDGYQQLYKVFRDNSTYEDGVVYSLPFNKSFPVLFSNKDILALVGEDKEPETWQELERISKKINKELVYDKASGKAVRKNGANDSRSPIYGYSFAVDPWLFGVMLLQNGGKMTNEEQTKVAFDSKKSQEALMWWVNSVMEKWAYRSEGYNLQNDFGAQKVAFIVTSAVSQKFMQKKLRFNYKVTRVPTGGVVDRSVMSGTNVCIFSGIGENRTLGAWDFIRWLNSPEITAYWGMNTYYVPTRKDAMKLPVMQKHLQNSIGGRAASDQLDIGTSEPRSSAWYRCRIILRSYMDKIITLVENSASKSEAEKIVERYLKEASTKMNRELSKYSPQP